ncbi:MAG TPA: aminotransferase class V-fold PLP-dependent enzyme [Phycisphaerae bacterium]|nr:aminotransferase class V-fold PLP-dependent enzyme [Phycisphaerae bacterium]
MIERITYLDNNATTRVADEVVAAMLPCFTEAYGNPSSVHHFGAQVAARIEQARAHVAALIGARESEIVFTSGGTEADNAALRGVAAARPSKRHIVISTIEHPAILETAEQLERDGLSVTRVGVDGDGRVDLDALAAAVRPDTLLVSIMLANNETGVIQPLRQIADIAHRGGALAHTDAVQAIAKMPVNVGDLAVDLLSLSSHKFHGPKGAGALYVRGGTAFRSIMFGGPQERGRRGGTLNAPGIIGLGAACRLAAEHLGAADTLRRLRDRMEREIVARIPGAHVMGAAAPRLCNTSCICFAGVEAEAVLVLLSEAGVCVSSGAACHSGSLEPSHVICAMGVDPAIAQGQLRFSLSRFNTEEDVDRLVALLPQIIAKVAAVSA